MAPAYGGWLTTSSGSFPPLRSAVDAVTESAGEEFNRRQDLWAPLAKQVREWSDQAAGVMRPKTRSPRSERWRPG